MSLPSVVFSSLFLLFATLGLVLALIGVSSSVLLSEFAHLNCNSGVVTSGQEVIWRSGLPNLNAHDI
jgi:hypothetical protein